MQVTACEKTRWCMCPVATFDLRAQVEVNCYGTKASPGPFRSAEQVPCRQRWGGPSQQNKGLRDPYNIMLGQCCLDSVNPAPEHPGVSASCI